MRSKPALSVSQQELKQMLLYDPSTGSITWIKDQGARARPGVTIKPSSKFIAINKVNVAVTKIIFLYMTGEYPQGYIYRHDKDVNNNQWSNLYLTKGKDNLLTQQGLKKLCKYDPHTGIFTKVSTGHLMACKHPKGYLVCSIKGKSRKMHQMVWLYIYGYIPKHPLEIDHINRDKEDNRLCNLREVTHQQNMMNQPIRVTNKSGVTGVNWHPSKNRWVAHISVGGVKKHLITTDDFNKAVAARKQAELEHYKILENLK